VTGRASGASVSNSKLLTANRTNQHSVLLAGKQPQQAVAV